MKHMPLLRLHATICALFISGVACEVTPTDESSDILDRPTETDMKAYIPEITFLKANTSGVDSLSDSEKCLISANTVLQFASKPVVESGHFKVALTTAPADCGFKDGYIFLDQMS